MWLRAFPAVCVTVVSCLSCGGSQSLGSNAAGRDAIAAYRAMWDDMAIASHTDDYQSPLLSQHADGAALELLRQGLYANLQLHQVNRGSPVLSPHVVSATRSAVQIVDCFDDTSWPSYTGTTSQDPKTLGRHRNVATVVRVGGAWKVVELSVGDLHTC